MTPEHVVDPGPEQTQGRRAFLPCWQVRPPDGLLAPSLGRLPLGPLRYQRGEVIEPGSEFGNGVPLRLNVLAEGGQPPVQPLILIELLAREVIEVVFEVSDSVPLRLNVLAEGGQPPVQPLILVELALLVPAEVSQELGQLADLSVEPFEAASTVAEGFVNVGQPHGDRGDLLGQGRHLPPLGRPLCLAHGLVLTRRRYLWLRHGLVLTRLLDAVRCQWRHAGPAGTMMLPAPGSYRARAAPGQGEAMKGR